MVSQLRNAKLPPTIRMICRPSMNSPDASRARRGQKANHGTTSSTKKVKSTPNMSTGCGRKWKWTVSGFGIGSVSKK